MKKILAVVLAIGVLLSAMPAFAASKAAEQEIVTESFAGEIIVSVKDSEKTGDWKESTAIKNFDGSSNFFASPEASVTFKPDGLKNGNYELYYWVPFHVNNPGKLVFTVNHNGKQSETFVYAQTAADETVAPGWVSMGVFDFAGAGDENVLLTARSNNTRATAVKFVPTDKEATGKMEEEQKSTTPGDASLSNEIEADPMGKCVFIGPWSWSSAVLGPLTQAPNSLWVAGAGPEAYVEYNPDIMADCNVRISVYLLYWSANQTTDVKYTVFHNGKKEEFHLDPTSITESQWVTLGTFDFGGNSEDYVLLECTGTGVTNTNTRASTVAFEIINDDVSNPESNAAVWQTRYVTPRQDSESVYMAQKANMASLDKFSDMKDHWAHYDVEYMANEGLVSGVSETEFNPEAKISRAEYVTILDRAMKYELVSGESYADVSADAWYAPYVATAKANGLLNGLPTEDGFKPEQPITREEMALFTYNAIKATKRNDEWVKTLPDSWASFTDTQSVSDWATDALKYLIQTGIIKGTSETTVSPMENATRAQGAVILKRFMQSFVWAGPPSDQEWVMTFNDEFLGNSVNFDVWESDKYPYGGGIKSTRGPDNLEVKDGSLYMLTKKEKKADKEWTTAHMWVKPDVFRQSYGYFEARYKICAANGLNNAFWLMTHPRLVSDGTQNFEIDINEGHYPNEVCPTYHHYETGEHKSNTRAYRAGYDLSQDYHTYALEWTEAELIYYFDGEEIARYTNANAHIPLFPYLSSAVLSWAGSIDNSADGTAQVVDYVRVWQTKADAENPERTLFNQPMTAPALNGIAAVTIDAQKVDNATKPGEIIIAPEHTGSWKDSSAAPNYQGTYHKFSQTTGDYADFKLDSVKSGKYKVYFWRLPHVNNKNQENIWLVKADGTESVVGSVALIPIEGVEADAGWIEIGEAELTATDVLRIKCNGLTTRTSGIKLVPVK